MKNIFFGFILFLGAIWACDTCNDCGPIENEPYVNIGFNFYSTKSSAEVLINSINGITADSISEVFYGDTLRIFKLPLNFNSDSSYFNITYSSYPDEDDENNSPGTYQDQIALKYNLNLVNQSDFIKYVADSLQVVYTTFDSVASQNINSQKQSNEVTIQLYF